MSTSFVRRAAQVATLVALAATAAHAQPVSKDQPAAGQPPAGGGRGMGGGGARQLQMMMEGITLSPAQQAQVDSITKAYAAKMPAMSQDMSQEDRQKMRQMNMERTAAIKAVLSADQQKTWDANMEKMRANMPQRPAAL